MGLAQRVHFREGAAECLNSASLMLSRLNETLCCIQAMCHSKQQVVFNTYDCIVSEAAIYKRQPRSLLAVALCWLQVNTVVGTEAQHTCALEGLGHRMAVTRHPMLDVSLQTHYASPPRMSTQLHLAGPSVCTVPAPARHADAVHVSEVGGAAVSHPFAGCQPTLHALPMPSMGPRKEGRRYLPGSLLC